MTSPLKTLAAHRYLRSFPCLYSSGRVLSFQRLAHESGLAFLNPACHLCVHPVYGPWISLRAVVVLDAPGLPDTECQVRAPSPRCLCLLRLSVSVFPPPSLFPWLCPSLLPMLSSKHYFLHLPCPTTFRDASRRPTTRALWKAKRPLQRRKMSPLLLQNAEMVRVAHNRVCVLIPDLLRWHVCKEDGKEHVTAAARQRSADSPTVRFLYSSP